MREAEGHVLPPAGAGNPSGSDIGEVVKPSFCPRSVVVGEGVGRRDPLCVSQTKDSLHHATKPSRQVSGVTDDEDGWGGIDGKNGRVEEKMPIAVERRPDHAW